MTGAGAVSDEAYVTALNAGVTQKISAVTQTDFDGIFFPPLVSS
jgi:hypothetical protein